MQLYTPEQFIDDIERFEHCEVTGDMSIRNTGVRFLKLYSECFEEKLSVDGWHQRMEKRLSALYSNTDVLLPTCDIYPSNDKAFYVYRVNWSPSRLLRETNLEFIGTLDCKEEINKYFDPKSGEMSICIVSTKTEEIMYFDRNRH